MKTSRTKFTTALGIALLLQAITSLISGAMLFDPLLKNSIGATMASIAQNPVSAHLSVLLDIVTAIGIVWLGILLFTLLKKEDRVWAGTAMGCYLLEAGMLVVSKIFVFALIRISESYLISGNQSLAVLGQVLLQAKDFSADMAMIPFGVGAILFYYLLFKNKALPSWIPLWGLAAVVLILIGVPLMAYGIGVPPAVLVPYVPFEFFTGAYILIRGLRGQTAVFATA